MINPWLDNGAFRPMFTEMVTIGSNTVAACVFPIEDVDPFADADVENDTKQYSVLVFKEDWPNERMKIGDAVYSTATQLNAKITSVDDEQTWYRITARSIG